MLRRLCAVLVLVALAAPGALASQWNISTANSSIGFTVTHMLINRVSGRFTQFDGNINFDPDSLIGGSVTMTIKAASITTDNTRRDNDLRSADFFDVEKYPEITFKSTKVVPVDSNTVQIVGDLTMHGVTKPVTFKAVLNGIVKGMGGRETAGFSATATINRQDFGINWNHTLDSGGLVVSNDVDISVSLELVEVTSKGGQ